MSSVAVIGGGLAGSLLALELADLGQADLGQEVQLEVVLIDGGSSVASATGLSYGAVAAWAAPPTALGRLMRQSPGRWRRWQRRLGPLGWRRRWLQLQGAGPLRRLPLPCGQVEAPALLAALPALLERQGIRRIPANAAHVQPEGQAWRLQLADGQVLQSDQVVLAAGAACRSLWPALSSSLRVSWAGVIELEAWPVGLRPGLLRLPARFGRIALERRAPQLQRQEWVVDPGLVPWRQSALAGQISLVRPGLEPGVPPDAALMEQRLRQALEALEPAIGQAPGRYRQAAVAFCSDGQPLVGPVPAAAGLWQFCGFSAAFAQVPVLAPLQAAAIAGSAAAGLRLKALTGRG